MDANLTPKQARFVDEYLVDGNGTRAAVAAGYGLAGAAVAAHRVLKNAKARAEIAARQGVCSQRLQIERQDVLKGLLEAFAMAREKREPASMVTAAREVGRMLGLYSADWRQVEVVAGTSGDRRHWEAMSDTELAGLVVDSAATAVAP